MFDDIECGVIPSKSGDPIFDIRGLFEYCDEHGIDRTNGVPQELAEKFIIGYKP